jgi:hypothetical protein
MPQASAARKAPPFRASTSSRRPAPGPDKPEHEILFQTYFKSVGPRTYAAQVKKASNENHYLVLTEGKRDEKTGEVRKARLFVYSEDFGAFFRMLQETSLFIRANPVPEEVKKRRVKFWARKEAEPKSLPPGATVAQAPKPPGGAAAGGGERRQPTAPPRTGTPGR